MEHHIPRDHATSNVLAWTTTHSANVEPSVEEDAGADADEPPDCPAPMSPMSPMSPISAHFHRTPIRRGSEHHESLLTKALQSQSDEDAYESEAYRQPRRRRSITSNTSLASTCGTAITTPARTSSPSPRLPNVGFVPLAVTTTDAPQNKASDVSALVKKRCISFACAAKPKPDEKTSMLPPPKPTREEAKTEGAPKRTSIKFACPSKPAKATDAQQLDARPRTPVPRGTPSTTKGLLNQENVRSSSTVRAFRSPTSRRAPGSPVASRNKKWLSADSGG
jgi:hypothetical protein